MSQLAHSASPYNVAFGFAASKERETQRVTFDYQHYLDRPPDPDGLTYWVNRFLQGTRNEGLVGGFVGSQEYYLNHGDNARDWLFAAYGAILGRPPDDGGLATWLTALQ